MDSLMVVKTLRGFDIKPLEFWEKTLRRLANGDHKDLRLDQNISLI